MQARTLVGLTFLVVAGAFALSCAGPRPDTAQGDVTSGRTYLVQVKMTERKAAAERMRRTALKWWNAVASGLPEPVAGAGASPVRITWRAPLYRVRLGPFASRAQADSVLSAAREEFPDAFVAPSLPSSSSTP